MLSNYIFLLLGATVLVRGLLSIYRYVLRSRDLARIARENKCQPLPRYPHKDPILGLDYFLVRLGALKKNQFITRQIEDLATYGDTYGYTEFGREYVVTRDPENIKAILCADADAMGVQPARGLSFAPLLEKSFFSNDGPVWRRTRDDIRPILSRGEYADLGLLEKYVDKFVRLLPKDGQPVELNVFMARMMQDYISEYVSNKSVDSMSTDMSAAPPPIVAALHDAFEVCSNRMMLGVALSPLLRWVPNPKKLTNACSLIHSFVDAGINDAFTAARSSDRASHPPLNNEKAAHSTRGTFLEGLTQKNSDREYLRGVALSVFAAGFDTTSTMLANVLFCLSRNQQAQEKVLEEIAEFKGLPPTFTQLQKMTYLRACVDETLRLYNIAPFTIRTSYNDFLLPNGGGPNGNATVLVPKGTTFIPAFKALHLDQKIWGPDATEFRPERLLEKKSIPWTYYPFGGGTRICPGQHMAITNMLYIVTRVFQEFKAIESRDERPYREKMKLIFSNGNGVNVAFIPK